MKKHNSILKIFSASLIGVFIALIMPYINGKMVILIKIATSIVLVFISAKQTGIKDYIFQLLLFYVITFSIGGGIFCLNNLFSNNLIINSINKKLLPFYICLICILILYVVFNINYLIASLKHKSNIYKIKFIINGITANANGFCDTGNLLDYNNCAVSIINREIFNNFYNNLKITEIEYIKCSTINGDSLLPIYKIDKLILYKNKKQISFFNTYIAVSAQKINFDIILHNSIYFKEE